MHFSDARDSSSTRTGASSETSSDLGDAASTGPDWRARTGAVHAGGHGIVTFDGHGDANQAPIAAHGSEPVGEPIEPDPYHGTESRPQSRFQVTRRGDEGPFVDAQAEQEVRPGRDRDHEIKCVDPVLPNDLYQEGRVKSLISRCVVSGRCGGSRRSLRG